MNNKWPKAGDKLIAKDILPDWFYPHFTDIVEDGKANIIPGQEYTVKDCEVHSSWCAVWLEELPPLPDQSDRFFHLSFFNWNY